VSTFTSQRFLDKAEIEHLARRNLFGHAQAFLGEIDDAAHPGVIRIGESAGAAELQILYLLRQRTAFDAEICGNDVDGFGAVLGIILHAFQSRFYEGENDGRIVFDFILRGAAGFSNCSSYSFQKSPRLLLNERKQSTLLTSHAPREVGAADAPGRPRDLVSFFAAAGS
jgi:hypothetical protein